MKSQHEKILRLKKTDMNLHCCTMPVKSDTVDHLKKCNQPINICKFTHTVLLLNSETNSQQQNVSVEV